VRQQSLPWQFDEPLSNSEELVRTSFSHNGVSPQSARQALEQRYMALLEETDRFDRRLVSYQGNKRAILHSWFKYREGFSAQLVEQLIEDFALTPGDTILEPFSGSATTLLVARSLGIDATGIELLPVCHLAWEAKSHVYEYDLDELDRVLDLVRTTEPGKASTGFPHIVITETAFPTETENALMFYTGWFEALEISSQAKSLLRLALTSILEEISYTRKDGQYLRWDARSEKVQRRNRKRLADGKQPIKGMNKGQLPDVKQALRDVRRTSIVDIRRRQ
jgi:site-specific DNA-methyltransferase (cytosine-N4-specific)